MCLQEAFSKKWATNSLKAASPLLRGGGEASTTVDWQCDASDELVLKQEDDSVGDVIWRSGAL